MTIRIITAFAISQDRVVLLGSFEDRYDAIAAFDVFVKKESPETEWSYDWESHIIGDHKFYELAIVNTEEK